MAKRPGANHLNLHVLYSSPMMNIHHQSCDMIPIIYARSHRSWFNAGVLLFPSSIGEAKKEIGKMLSSPEGPELMRFPHARAVALNKKRHFVSEPHMKCVRRDSKPVAVCSTAAAHVQRGESLRGNEHSQGRDKRRNSSSESVGRAAGIGPSPGTSPLLPVKI